MSRCTPTAPRRSWTWCWLPPALRRTRSPLSPGCSWPPGRRRGIGRALLEEATQEAVRRGRRAVLDVVEDHVAAIELYESCGWTRAGRVDWPCRATSHYANSSTWRLTSGRRPANADQLTARAGEGDLKVTGVVRLAPRHQVHNFGLRHPDPHLTLATRAGLEAPPWPRRSLRPLTSQFPESGRGDLNPRPQRPERCALTKLRYFPLATHRTQPAAPRAAGSCRLHVCGHRREGAVVEGPTGQERVDGSADA